MFLTLCAVFAEFFYTIQLPPILTCIVTWTVGISVYALHCAGQPNWIRAFMHYQVFGIIATVGNFAVVIGIAIPLVLLAAATEAPPAVLIFALMIAIGPVVLVRPMRWFARRADAELEQQVRAFARRTDERAKHQSRAP